MQEAKLPSKRASKAQEQWAQLIYAASCVLISLSQVLSLLLQIIAGALSFITL